MTTPVVYTFTARNTARSSPNKMHDDDVARSFGFAGGLVPGVTIFAWMCHAPMEAYGATWIRQGTIAATFVRPIYEGDDVTMECLPEGGSLALTVSARGDTCATGTATEMWAARPGDDVDYARAPLPEERPPASPAALVPGSPLGTVEATFDQDQAAAYLESIGAGHPLTEAAQIAPPGWLVLLANLALSNNVTLGPWIHVSTEMRFLDYVQPGERVSALARVADRFERKGNRFVDLGLLLVAGDDDRAVASVLHRAIYEPRRA